MGKKNKKKPTTTTTTTKQNKNKNKQQLWCTFNWYFSMVSKVVSIKNKNA